MTSPTLGITTEGVPLTLDVAEWIGTDLAVIAKKGFGKSGLLRVLFEQTHGLIQQIILDPEGEFHTLREVGDYLIAGGDDADCPATVQNAAALAKMLMENPGISAIIQLDHLKGGGPELFVAIFIEALMETPREHWHPVMVCVDETQRFAPQEGKVASSDAMEDMVQRGRKRGITPVFATLSNSAIDKDLTRGISTWFFGRVGTDIDRKIAANSLTFTASSPEAKGLALLPRRRFWAFGNAVGDLPILFDVSDAKSTIFKAGAGVVAMPPPPASMGALIAALAEAAAPPPEPEPRADEVRAPAGATLAEVGEALQSVTDYVHQPSYNAGAGQGHFDGYQEGMAIGEAYGGAYVIGQIRAKLDALQRGLYDGLTEEACREVDRLASISLLLQPSTDAEDSDLHQPAHKPPLPVHTEAPPVHVPGRERRARAKQADQAVSGNIAAQGTPAAARAMLEALAKVHPAKLTWAQVAGLANRKPKGGSFNAARRWMLDELTVLDDGHTLTLTPVGMAIAPPPTTGESKLEVWLRAMKAMPPPAADILQYVYDHPGITVPDLAEALGRQPKGGSWNAGISTVKRNGLIEADDDGFLFCTDLVKD